MVFVKTVQDRADGLYCMRPHLSSAERGEEEGGEGGSVYRVYALTVTRPELASKQRHIGRQNVTSCREHPRCLYCSLGQVLDEDGHLSNEFFFVWIFSNEAGYRDHMKSSARTNSLTEIREYMVTIDYY